MYKVPNFFSKKNFNFDVLGKSPAFFLKNDNVKIDKKFFLNLVNFSKMNKNINCRVCIHKNKKSKMYRI